MFLEDSFLEKRLLAQNAYEFFILKDCAKLEWRPFPCDGAFHLWGLTRDERYLGQKEHRVSIRQGHVLVLALPPSRVTLTKSLNLCLSVCLSPLLPSFCPSLPCVIYVWWAHFVAHMEFRGQPQVGPLKQDFFVIHHCIYQVSCPSTEQAFDQHMF